MGVAANAFNLSTWEPAAGGLPVLRLETSQGYKARTCVLYSRTPVLVQFCVQRCMS